MGINLRLASSQNGTRNVNVTVDLVSPGGAFSPAAVGDGVTDDAPAFRAFNTWAQAQSLPIILTLGSGAKTFLLNSGDAAHGGARRNSLVYGVTKPLRVIGNGPSTSIFKSGTQGVNLGTSSLKSGTGFFGSSTDWTARLNSVSAGTTQVTCKTLADALLFSINTWALLTGIDMMAQGFPPNPFWFEYVYITAIDTGTGVITFQSPVTNSYLDTWPHLADGNPGLQADQGGPATLYALDPTFNIDVTYQDLGVDNTTQGPSYAGGKTVTFNNVKCHDNDGITPSGNKLITFIGCDLSSYEMESDKLIEHMVFDGTSTGSLKFQSSQNSVEIKNGCNISAFNGTPRVTEITGSTVGNVLMGATSFGRTDSFITSGSTFTGTYTDTAGVSDGGDVGGGSIQIDYSISAGVIRIPKAGLDYGCRWMIPNTWCYWSNGTSYGPTFKVLSVYDDATYIYAETDWVGGFPSWATRIKMVSSLNINFASDTVTSAADYINKKAATAAGYYLPQTYTTRQFNGSNLGRGGTGNDVGIYPVSGHVVSLTIDVSTAYTGAQGTLTWKVGGGEFNNKQVYKSDLTTASYAPIIDLKTPGTRIITPAGVTGSVGSDSGLALPDAGTWLTRYFEAGILASANIVAEYNGNNAVGPVVTVTAITDQGIS